jgi:hypothetical protein
MSETSILWIIAIALIVCAGMLLWPKTGKGAEPPVRKESFYKDSKPHTYTDKKDTKDSGVKKKKNNNGVTIKMNFGDLEREINPDQDPKVKVIMKYRYGTDIWICPDCETENPKYRDTCIVCRKGMTG